jgi:hypothetical protein
MLFDISDFSISGLHVKEGYLFAMSRLLGPPTYTSHTLYRIELATMLATPINNPAYDELQDSGASLDFTATGTVRSAPSSVRTTACTGTRPESRIRPTTPYRLHNRSRYLPLTSGFFTMSPVTAGGVSLTWTAKALPAITLISGNHGYWREGDTIKRLHFSAGSSAEEIVTASSIIGFKVAAGVLIYTKYITGTNVGTYAVCSPGAEPVLLLSEDMEVQQIVEF